MVAFITAAADRATGNPTGEVLNAFQASFLRENITETMANDRPARWYTIDGRQTDTRHLTPGLYIIQDGKSIRKTIVR